MIFQDGNDTAWRQNWERYINEERVDEPAAVTLLLVIITPGLFSCDVCRDQVQWFLDRERARGSQDLIWPRYYITASEIDDYLLHMSDEMIRTLHPVGVAIGGNSGSSRSPRRWRARKSLCSLPGCVTRRGHLPHQDDPGRFVVGLRAVRDGSRSFWV
jgi:hypothetical protein